MSPDPDNLRSEQRVWPLVTVALCLTALGFVLAFRHADHGSDKHRPPSDVELPAALADTADDPGEPVELTYGSSGDGKERLLSMKLQQLRDGRNAAVVESGISVDVEQVSRSRDDGEPGIELTRTFRSARVTVSDRQSGEAGGESSPHIVRQVARMIDGSAERIRMTPTGKRDHVEWTSVTNPQVRRTLGLIRATGMMLMPRFRDEPVNVGESWTYRFPVPPKEAYEEDHPNLEIDGAVTVAARFAGVIKRDGNRLAVLVRRVEFNATGRSDSGSAAPQFSLSGSGRGEALFDIDERRVVESWLTLNRSASIQNERRHGGGEAEIRLRMTPLTSARTTEETEPAGS